MWFSYLHLISEQKTPPILNHHVGKYGIALFISSSRWVISLKNKNVFPLEGPYIVNLSVYKGNYSLYCLSALGGKFSFNRLMRINKTVNPINVLSW